MHNTATLRIPRFGAWEESQTSDSPMAMESYSGAFERAIMTKSNKLRVPTHKLSSTENKQPEEQKHFSKDPPFSLNSQAHEGFPKLNTGAPRSNFVNKTTERKDLNCDPEVGISPQSRLSALEKLEQLAKERQAMALNPCSGRESLQQIIDDGTSSGETPSPSFRSPRGHFPLDYSDEIPKNHSSQNNAGERKPPCKLTQKVSPQPYLSKETERPTQQKRIYVKPADEGGFNPKNYCSPNRNSGTRPAATNFGNLNGHFNGLQENNAVVFRVQSATPEADKAHSQVQAPVVHHLPAFGEWNSTTSHYGVTQQFEALAEKRKADGGKHPSAFPLDSVDTSNFGKFANSTAPSHLQAKVTVNSQVNNRTHDGTGAKQVSKKGASSWWCTASPRVMD